MKRRFLVGGVLLCAVSSAAVEPPARIHSVQVAARSADNVTEVEGLASRLRSAGWGPVYAEAATSTALTRVCVGRFETIADATWWKLALRKRGYPDAFIVSRENTDRAEAVAPAGPLTPNFRTPARFASASGNASDAVGTATGTLTAGTEAETGSIGAAEPPAGASGSSTPPASAGRGALAAVRDALTPERRATVDLWLSTTPERNTADATQTRELVTALQPIADGDASTSRSEICRARVAIAHAWHYGGVRRWLTSYHCYGEALALADPGSPEEAECLLQRAGLLMELANSGLGTMEECRRACDLVRERVPVTDERAHSVAALMHAEAFFHDKRYEEALAESAEIERQWPDRRREIAMANVFAGLACERLNRLGDAEEYFKAVVDMRLQTDELFQWRGKRRDLVCDAARRLNYIAIVTEKHAEAKSWRKLLEDRSSHVGVPEAATAGQEVTE